MMIGLFQSAIFVLFTLFLEKNMYQKKMQFQQNKNSNLPHAIIYISKHNAFCTILNIIIKLRIQNKEVY